MGKQLSDVPCRYGAPMGRRDRVEDPLASVRVSLVRMRVVDGDYDDGGAYWGFGPGSNPIYIAKGEGVLAFVRAANREDAKADLKRKYPNLRFYR